MNSQTSSHSLAWEPEAEQTLLLSADEDEVLYGGEPGSGKSDGLLVDALGLNIGALNSPGYRALITRSTFPHLAQLIERSKQIYPSVFPSFRAQMYNGQAKEWTFPSGAKIKFGYLAADADKDQYQGPAFAYIGIDELTQIELKSTYQFMVSRNRNAYGLRNYMRATCNPNGPGYMWVKIYWGIPYSGEHTKKVVTVVGIDGTPYQATLRFIRGRLKNNKHISNSDYQKKLAQLPPKERDRLMGGFWPDSDDTETLISSNAVREAANHSSKEIEAIGPIILGVDPSYKGKDGSAFYIRRGRLVLHHEKVYGLDSMQITVKIMRLIEKFNVDAVAIDFGYGTGAYDRLRELGYGHMAYLINFGSKALDEQNYINRRAEMYGLLANWIETENPKIPDNESLIAQLEQVPYERDTTHRLKIKSKHEIKELLGESPDDADALALTFSVPHVHRVEEEFQDIRKRGKEKSYIPPSYNRKF